MTELEIELKRLVDCLCDNLLDFPAGCDACWLFDDDEGICEKRKVYAKYEIKE